jgi:hypothetical protein
VICPFPLVSQAHPELAVRPIELEFIYRDSFTVLTVRPMSRPARAFMRHVQSSARSHARAGYVLRPREA